jgi:hypothetical protein
MILNIFLTSIIFTALFLGVIRSVDETRVSDGVAAVVVYGFLISVATLVITALLLIWAN